MADGVIGHGSSLTDRLHHMLTLAGVEDEEIINGPSLTENGTRKVARELGIQEDEVPVLMRALTAELRDQQTRFDEMMEDFSADEPTARFVHAVDSLKNVTVTDTQSGKSCFLRGSKAIALLNRLKHGDSQEVLSAYAPLMEAPITVPSQAPRAMHHSDEDHEAERPHYDALEKTGFYGSQGAGALVMCSSTGRIMLAKRSAGCTEPGTWGNFGGALPEGKDPQTHALREMFEESGYDGEVSAVFPMLVFTKGTFRYSNFLVVVPEEFRPHLNWEADDAQWFEPGEWPQPLHFGVQAILKDSKSVATIKKVSGGVSESAVMEGRKKAMLDESFDDEIQAVPHGAYNFPWRLGRHGGTATARFKGRGRDMEIKIISVRDAEGEHLDLPQEKIDAIQQQAIDFIGDE